MPALRCLLVTGASGRVGTLIRPGLASVAATVRLTDLRPADAPLPHEQQITGDLVDIAAEATAGCDGILHLAAVSTEAEFGAILQANIVATEAIYRAAHKAGVRRIFFASSNHVTGFYPSGEMIGPTDPVRPDGLYAVSKVWGEALARYYFDRFGVESAVVRLGSVFAEPTTARHRATWISPRDLVALIGRVFAADQLGFTVLYGASDNTRSWWRAEGYPAGWQPGDRADDFAALPDGSPGKWQGGDLPLRGDATG